VIKAVFDTNIYIDRLNHGLYADLFDSTLQYLNGVVLMELYAGAFSRKDRNLIEKLEQVHKKVQRLLVPTASVFREAGNVLRILGKNQGIDPNKRGSLINDILIALSSLQIGATVFTQNKKDYRLIQSVKKFNLEIVKASLR